MQIGPYTIERELGRGGMGAVYLGRTAPGASPVAVKVVHTALSWDADVEARFQAEGDALEALNHPNLVRLRDRGRGQGGHWIAMDFVEGRSLGSHLETHGPWANEAARDLLLALCAGIAHAHYEGVLHRDLKPENVLLRAPDLHPLIVDFGLARPLDLSQHLTATGEILGSPGFLAPEQCGAGGRPTLATDVYGLGAVLYTVLTGEPPFRGANLLATLDLVLSAAPRPPRELRAEVDPWLEAICLRCLAKDPTERFSDASALADALQAGPLVELGGRSRWRTRGWLVALALALVGGGAWLGWPTPSRGPDLATASSPAPSSAAGVSPSPTTLWRRGPWGAKHLALRERTDLEALRARCGLISREADAIEIREEGWVARRARAIALARRRAADASEPASSEAGAEWVRTIAVDDFYGDSLDETSELVAARDRARELVKGQRLAADVGQEGLRLKEALARLEFKAWRRLPPSERVKGQGPVLQAWEDLSQQDDAWWREAVRVEVLTDSEPVAALRALEAIELAAGSASPQAWVEYLRARFLRRRGAQAPEYLRLMESVGEWPGASATLRAKARLFRGAHLDLEEDPRARAVLEQVDQRALSPWRRFGLRVRLARLSLRVGELDETRTLLASLPDELPAELRFPLGLLRAELQAREGKLKEADQTLVMTPPPTDRVQVARLLYLRATMGQANHSEALVERLAIGGTLGVLEADRVLQRAAQDPLWKLHLNPGIERLAERVRARLAGSDPTRELLEELLADGRWRDLISLTRVTLAEGEPRRYASLVGHALLAAEELDVPKVEIARAAQEAASAIRGASAEKAQGRALLGAFALRQTPAQATEAQARRTAIYAETLERAWGGDPNWAMAPSELIRLYGWAGEAHPEFRDLDHGIALRWLAVQEKSLPALVALCWLEPSPERVEELNSRVRAGPLTRERVRGILTLRRWRRLLGAKLSPLYDFVHEPTLRLALRREFFLEDARRELGAPGKESAKAALIVLGRLRRWCPPNRLEADLELLEARAKVEAGRLEEAGKSLARVREVEALSKEEIAELLMLEARRLQLLGRGEEAKTKLLASLAAAVTPASSLDYARLFVGMGGGAASATVYGQALGYQRSIPQVKRILLEVEQAGADPLVALEIGARELTIRVSALKALNLLLRGSADLKRSERLLELQAVGLVRLSRARLERGLELPLDQGISFKKGPWAERAKLLLEVHRLRRAARSPEGAGHLARLLELEAALAAEARRVPPETRARWALRWELAQIALDLTQAPQVADALTHAERAEALLVEAEQTEHPEPARSLQLATLQAEVLRRPDRAAEALAGALTRARREHQVGLAGVQARARAIFLFNLGRFEEALADLKVALESGLEPTLRGEAYLQQAFCLARLGREGVLPSLRRARISTPLRQINTMLEIKTLEARWGSANAKQARERLAAVEFRLPQLKPGPRAMIRGMTRVAEAELCRHEGNLERALEVLDQAMRVERLPPGAVDERLTCDEASGAKGRADLLGWGPVVLKNPSLLPYEAERVRAALERAKAGD